MIYREENATTASWALTPPPPPPFPLIVTNNCKQLWCCWVFFNYCCEYWTTVWSLNWCVFTDPLWLFHSPIILERINKDNTNTRRLWLLNSFCGLWTIVSSSKLNLQKKIEATGYGYLKKGHSNTITVSSLMSNWVKYLDWLAWLRS